MMAAIENLPEFRHIAAIPLPGTTNTIVSHE